MAWSIDEHQRNASIPPTLRQPGSRATPARGFVIVGVALLLLGAAAFPLDKPVSDFFRHTIDTGGDLRRELHALQQFGQTVWTVLAALVIWQLDPPNRRRLLDLGLAMGVIALIVKGLKMTVGRARPALEDPALFIGWATDDKHWSMPSSHAAYAAVLAVFLAMLYPRLTWLVALLAGIVMFGRLHFGAHYPSDVLIGAGIGCVVTGVIVSRVLGVRLLDEVWVRVVDRHATPIYPRYLGRTPPPGT